MAIPRNDWVKADEISIRTMNTMRGKMCSLIEAMNLPKDQEEAVIIHLKQFSYDTQEIIAQLLDLVDEGDLKFKYNNRLLEVR